MIDRIARGRAWIFHAYRLLLAHTLGAPFVGGEGEASKRPSIFMHWTLQRGGDTQRRSQCLRATNCDTLSVYHGPRHEHPA
jgi:hypothetical protein